MKCVLTWCLSEWINATNTQTECDAANWATSKISSGIEKRFIGDIHRWAACKFHHEENQPSENDSRDVISVDRSKQNENRNGLRIGDENGKRRASAQIKMLSFFKEIFPTFFSFICVSMSMHKKIHSAVFVFYLFRFIFLCCFLWKGLQKPTTSTTAFKIVKNI